MIFISILFKVKINKKYRYLDNLQKFYLMSLLNLRKDLAIERGVPPAKVFADDFLVDIVLNKNEFVCVTKHMQCPNIYFKNQAKKNELNT